MTTKADINRWLDELYDSENITHMIVVCDEYDWDDYPVYVYENEDVERKAAEYSQKSMQRVMEVYSKNYDREDQLNRPFVFNYD